jgi:uncharacterized protein YqkB
MKIGVGCRNSPIHHTRLESHTAWECIALQSTRYPIYIGSFDEIVLAVNITTVVNGVQKERQKQKQKEKETRARGA